MENRSMEMNEEFGTSIMDVGTESMMDNKPERIQEEQQPISELKEQLKERTMEIKKLEESIQKLQKEIEEGHSERAKDNVKVCDTIGHPFMEIIGAGKQEMQKVLTDAMVNLQKEIGDDLTNEIDKSTQEVKKAQEDDISQLKTDVSDLLQEKIRELWTSMDNQIEKQDSEIKNLNSLMSDLLQKIDLMVGEVRKVDEFNKVLGVMTHVIGQAMDNVFPRLISMLPEESAEKEAAQDAGSEATPCASASSNTSTSPNTSVAPNSSATTAASASPSTGGSSTASVGRIFRSSGLEKALHQSVVQLRFGDVRKLLAQGVRVNTIRNGRTVLHSAAHQGNVEMITLLLDAGADLDSTDSQGRTPLHLAGAGCRAPAAALLIRRGAKIDARDANRCTPLHWAVRAPGTADCVRVLLTYGADPRAIDESGQTPMQMARSEEVRRVLRCIARCIRCFKESLE